MNCNSFNLIYNGETKRKFTLRFIENCSHKHILPGWTNQLLPNIASHLDTTLRNNEK